MKKIIFFIIILLLVSINILNSKCVCFYYKNAKNFTKATCEYYARTIFILFDDICEYKELNKLKINEIYDKIIIVGFGHYLGLFNDDTYEFDNVSIKKLILWKDIAKIKSNIMIIDSCYAGYIFDYKYKSKILITSTYKENSWNTIYNNKNVSTLSVTLLCKFDKDFNCPINCDKLSISMCHIKLILYSIINIWKKIDVHFFNWEYPSIGSCVVNEKPCK